MQRSIDRGIVEFKKDLVNIINTSGLPLGIITLVLENMLDKANMQLEAQLRNEQVQQQEMSEISQAIEDKNQNMGA